MKDYLIKCPNCKSTFDCSGEIEAWKLELITAVKLLKEIKEIINNKKRIKK